MGRIEAGIALHSWLFEFRLCAGQGQFTLSAQILPIEPQDQHKPIHRVPVYGASMIVIFFSKAGADIAVESWVSEFWP